MIRLNSVLVTVLILTFVTVANAALNTELVNNGTFESGTLFGSWTIDNNGGEGDPPRVEPGVLHDAAGWIPLAGTWFGNYFYFAGAGTVTQSSQVIDVSADAALIDSGTVQADLAAALSSYSNNDVSTITAYFKDASNVDLGSSVSVNSDGNPVRNIADPGCQESVSGQVPVGTRSIRLEINSVRNGGYWNDGYIDNVSLKFSTFFIEPEVEVGPFVLFRNKAEITIYWKTADPTASVIEYGPNGTLSMQAEDLTPKTDHQLTINNINPETEYSYRVVIDTYPKDTYTFYSAFDYGVNPFPGGNNPYPVDSLTPLYEQAAEYIVNTIGINKGVCIDYGCGQGRLAYELAKRSELKIIGFEQDAAAVAQARNYLDQAKVYGTQVHILEAPLTALKCNDYSANLIVSDKIISSGTCPGSAAEIFRVLRPDGGVAFLGQPDSCPSPLVRSALENWLNAASLTYNITQDPNGLWANISRDPLAGAGSWKHFYADLANTANSGDTRIQGSLKMLWHGNPGPRYIIDRHNKPMSSLYHKGIVITPGLHRLMAYDIYNGSRYWDMAIPESGRSVTLRDCGWVALDDNYAYTLHKDDCVALNLKTGEPTLFFQTPQLVDGQKRNWGFIAVEGNNIFGTGQKEGASRIGHSLEYALESYRDYKPIGTGEYLYCYDKNTGTIKWTYQRAGGSAIVSPSIVITGDYIYFIESRNPAALTDSDGRVPATVLMQDNYEYLVKINKNTGVEATGSPKQITLPFEHSTFLSYAPAVDLLIATGSRNNPGMQYENCAFSPADLSNSWNCNFYIGTTNTNHGEQDQHPCIVGSTMFVRYYKIDLTNGTTTSFSLQRTGCGTQASCSNRLFARYSNPSMFEITSTTATKLTNDSRPGCWVSIIPAGGLVLVPEGDAGCTCDYPVQSTMVFVPN
ncbi:MAG: methyltransferase domain-containing protein [Sedimentisphaerales bacterium]|nr:methyltransferase domain-containing protein [Sedimentisphaerales bacterium]